MAKKNDFNEQQPFPDLVYPIFVNVPIVVSFLASIRDGVSYEDETTRRGSVLSTRFHPDI